MVNVKGVVAGVAGLGVLALAWMGPDDGAGSTASCSDVVASAAGAGADCESQAPSSPVNGTSTAARAQESVASTPPKENEEAAPSAATDGAPGTTSAAQPPTGSGHDDSVADGHGVDPSGPGQVPSPTPFDAAEAQQWASAKRTATAFVRAWSARPGDTRDKWLARVSPYMTVEARGTYSGVWPIKNGWSSVTGPATVRPWVDAEMAYLDLPVAVTTNVGVVVVHIDASTPQGLVTSFELPNQG